MLKGDDDKKSWASFQERIMCAPDQVLRYCRYAKPKPLWPMPSGQPSNRANFTVDYGLCSSVNRKFHSTIMVYTLVKEAWLKRRNLLGFRPGCIPFKYLDKQNP